MFNKFVLKMPGRTKKRLSYGNRKPTAPLVSFTLRKSYVVQLPVAGAAPQSGALMQINASSPFKPMTAVSGTWIEQNTVSEPFGLDSDIYAQYRHIVVLGSHVTCVVRDNPDLPASGTYDKVQGTVTLTRTTDTGIVTPTSLNSDLQQTFGTRQRNFIMAAAGQGNITKNAILSNGYSAKKTFSCPATSNNQLWINNTSGSSNIPADNTYIMCMVRPTMDTLSGSTLKDLNVDFKIVYKIRFLEPTAPENIPMPMKSKKYDKSKDYWRVNKLLSTLQWAPAAAAAGAGYYALKYPATAARFIRYQARPALGWR